MNLDQLLAAARQAGSSDLHITVGLPPMLRVLGALTPMQGAPPVELADARALLRGVLTDSQWELVERGVDVDFCYLSADGLRNRANIYRQQGRPVGAFRLLMNEIPTLQQLGMPPVLAELAMLPRGLVLVTGPTGSGKSTTLAAMIDLINQNRRAHIITIEDPVEYKHDHKQCVVHQREVGVDVGGFSEALRSALREDPDVILVGEMRDLETIRAAVTAAETGHLVLSTLHTTGAANTIDRIIDVFPEEGQRQIRTQLSTVLKGVISQVLVPRRDNRGRTAAMEILRVTDSAANLIREGKCYQLASVIQTGSAQGMRLLDMDLGRLVTAGTIRYEDALEVCASGEMLRRYCTPGSRGFSDR